jgi:hypothetical protein
MARSAAALERRKLKVALHSYPELFIAARANIGHVWLQLICFHAGTIQDLASSAFR